MVTMAASFLFLFTSQQVSAQENLPDPQVLVRLATQTWLSAPIPKSLMSPHNPDTPIEKVNENWIRLKIPARRTEWLETLKSRPGVEFVQPDYPVHLLENFRVESESERQRLMQELPIEVRGRRADNPPIPAGARAEKTGADPKIKYQWGLKDIGAPPAWQTQTGNPEVVVALLDSGIDYTHEDLQSNLWRNKGETGLDAKSRDKSSNGVDDDSNGYVDDVIGWDFISNDNKPYDLTVSARELLSGGNAGHGTHCAGTLAARGGNAVGISGVAPNIRIMPLRIINEKGQGSTYAALRAILYAVANGAKIISASWGSEGEGSNQEQNKALREFLQYAQDQGLLFVTSAGNGHRGVGYDNDTDPKPNYPASYEHDAIISVTALDESGRLGPFANWGSRSVDIAAPGVRIYSTMVGNRYSDHVMESAQGEFPWNGTSMATPYVAGAAALYWSAHPEKNWRQVKDALLRSARKIRSLRGLCVSEGKLDLKALMSR